MQNNTKKDSVNNILLNVLVLCHQEGMVTEDGSVLAEVVFRRFTAEVFRQYRQDVRLREFHALMNRTNFVAEAIADRKEYQINVAKMLAEQEKMLSVKQEKASQELENDARKKPATDKNPFIASFQHYSLIRDDPYLEKITTGIEMTYAITVSRSLDPSYLVQGYSCLICRQNFLSAMAYIHHISTHGSPLTIQESADLKRTNSALNVTLLHDECQLTSTLKLANLQSEQIIVSGVYMYHKHFELFPISLQKVLLEPGTNQGFHIRNRMLIKSHDMYSLLIMYRCGEEQRDLLELHYLRVYEIKRGGFKSNHRGRNDRAIRAGLLGDYHPPKDLCTLAANNFQLVSSYTNTEKKLHDDIRTFYHADSKTRLNASNYTPMLELLTHIQDLNVQCDLAQYRADDALIIPTSMPRLYRIDTKQFTSLPVNLAEGDIIQLTVKTSGTNNTLQGTIANILYDHIIVELEDRVQANCRFQVKLQASRVVCRLELQALDIVRRHELAPLLFPSKAPKPVAQTKTITTWMNTCMVNNEEQQTAVRNILNRVSDPLPYILFGPPGTGKTTTLVEAIVQICSICPSAPILVAAQSNSACDEVALRLMKHLAPNKLYRFYSRSSEKRLGEIPAKLQQVSNLASGKHSWPTWEEVYGTRVLICTLSVCGRLVQSKIRGNHFKYVFIDECGSASEPSALLAIAGMVSSRGKLNASIVLAGDPYQLGPVIRSNLAAKMGLGVSMQERLMNLPVYQKDPLTNQYNNQLIIKLVKNYRSHEALIRFSNKQFYDNELCCLASAEAVTLAENWRWLPNKTFPIILHTVFGSNERSSKSKSFMNQTEIDTVEFYLDFILKAGINERKISQEDIGIISPYQLQVQRLKQMCLTKQWPTIEIGSVEQFQGREKLVIILSTARSHTPDVGFLNNVKRLNVALTRAKALLIVIGNSNTLQTDPNWYEFIKYCTTNQAIVGRCFGLDAKRIVEQTNRDAMFDALFNVLV
ncbi:putative helicase mov-10-B.1 [Armigeres subalbatus]|uniref:putative helicase mov-10-B.1 n=1 Tax=Armigeres subalbatus TaxID=124917 RepID=UPI002ED6BA00